MHLRAKLTTLYGLQIRRHGGASVQQGLPAAGGALGFYRLGLATLKRYSLYQVT